MDNERFLKRLKAAAQAADIVGLHMTPEENRIYSQGEITLKNRQKKLEKLFKRDLNLEEETLLMEQVLNEFPEYDRVVNKREEIAGKLENKLGQNEG